jgi:geranylgeranyl diphosphate synthase type II
MVQKKMERLNFFWKKNLPLLEKELKKYIRSNSLLYKVMAYSLLDGGKRLRPLLVLAASESVGGKIENVLPAACALEMIHTFSLIHDDLPALDNDDFRRGKLSSHKKFGEALAILAGDALLTKAFEILAETTKEAGSLKQVLKEVSYACGGEGMIGGQVMDITLSSKFKVQSSKLEKIYRKKTGALIKVCLKIGALLSGAKSDQLRALEKYGENIGLAFQIGDDLIDYKQQKEMKLWTYPRIFGIKQTKKRIKELTMEAKKALKIFGPRGKILKEFADLVSTRKK